MIKNLALLSFFIYVMALAMSCCCQPQPLMPSEVENIARPTRPKTFGSPDELRSYLDQLGQYLAVVSRPRFGKRISAFSIPSVLSKSRIHQYNGKQHSRVEGDESNKLQLFKPAVISNSKDLYDMLFSPHRENDNNKYYMIQQDIPNTDIGLD